MINLENLLIITIKFVHFWVWRRIFYLFTEVYYILNMSNGSLFFREL